MPFDRPRFIDTYKAEARAHLQKLNLGLLKLEKSPKNKELLEEMMRQAHTIKGSSTMMGYKRIADIAHRMEDGLERAMKGEFKLIKPQFDILFKCLDAIPELLEDKVTWQDKGIERPFVDELCKEVEDVFAGKIPKKKAKVSVTRGPSPVIRLNESRVTTDEIRTTNQERRTKRTAFLSILREKRPGSAASLP